MYTYSCITAIQQWELLGFVALISFSITCKVINAAIFVFLNIPSLMAMGLTCLCPSHFQ